MIIDRLKGLFRAEATVPPGAVFPVIDEEALARELDLAARGREQGARDLPRAEDQGLDAAEMAAVARVAEGRRRGIENYETNKDVYAKRLSRASTASLEVRSVAGAARGDFELEVKAFRGRMTAAVKDLKEWDAALNDFRRRHRLHRPAFPSGHLASAATILLLGLMVETVLNGYLFAQRNELGLLGGGLVAVLISGVNVTVSTLAGLHGRLVRHAHPLAALAGLLVILAWIAFTLGFNLAVAHFRDAVEGDLGWSAAATASLASLTGAPLSLTSIESWLLMLVGCLVGLLAFLKFASWGEPYPGYARVSRRFEGALDAYADQLVQALESLESSRDAAIEGLQEANEVVRENIGDAIDALYGHRMMRAQLSEFLSGCDLKAGALLRLYRDENRAARATEAPARFDRAFAFPAFEDAGVDMAHREDAQRELAHINRIVDEAIAAIHADYRALKDDYPDPDALIGLDMRPRSASRGPEPEPAAPGPRLGLVEGSRRG